MTLVERVEAHLAKVAMFPEERPDGLLDLLGLRLLTSELLSNYHAETARANRAAQELDEAREFLGRDLREAMDRVTALEIEHQRERARANREAAARQEAERERDSAIAHDRQPYPTAAAYEQVCKLLAERTAERDDLRAQLAALKG